MTAPVSVRHLLGLLRSDLDGVLAKAPTMQPGELELAHDLLLGALCELQRLRLTARQQREQKLVICSACQASVTGPCPQTHCPLRA